MTLPSYSDNNKAIKELARRALPFRIVVGTVVGSNGNVAQVRLTGQQQTVTAIISSGLTARVDDEAYLVTAGDSARWVLFASAPAVNAGR